MTALPSYLNKLTLLKQIPIFSGLNWFELNRIARLSQIVEFNKGDVICQQGSPADAFYALISGRVQSFTLNMMSQKEEIDLILRGMHFGIISTLTGENHTHTYEAINDSVVMRISKDDFDKLLKSTPKMAISLSQNLSQRIRKHVTRSRDTQESTIIAVYAPLKGSGSSTYAANLALHLREQSEKKVLLLSLSSDQNDQRIDLASIVYDHHKILDSIIKGRLPIDVLSVKFDKTNSAVLNKISQFISAPVNDYNYIVLDLPNEMDEVVLKILNQSDIINLVTVDRSKDLEMTRTVIDRLVISLKDKFHPDNIQVLISGIHPEVHLSGGEIKQILSYDVFMVLPNLDPAEFKTFEVHPGMTIVEVNKASEYSKVLRHLSRRISGVMIGIVLGGGAALGMAHIGVIKVLEREGIPIDVIVGSSMGGLVGAVWAIGNNAAELEKCGKEFESKSGLLKVFDPPVVNAFILILGVTILFVFKLHLLGLFFIMLGMPLVVFTIPGLVEGHGIAKWLRTKLGHKTFHDTKIPFKLVAYDLLRRKELIIDKGDLVQGVSKTIAIPGVIFPIMENDQMIIDGGVLNPLPTNVLVDMGVKKIIAVNVLQSPQDAAYTVELERERQTKLLQIPFNKHPMKYILIRLGNLLGKRLSPNVADIIVRTLQASEYILAEASAKQADVLIHPDLRGINWFELYEVNELIIRGEEAAQKALPAIKELVKR